MGGQMENKVQKEAEMTKTSKLLVAAGCALILAAVILKVAGYFNVIKPSSLLILANTSFILAILFKK